MEKCDKKMKEKLMAAERNFCFHIVDVFTGSKFAGNQLAVIKDADTLSTTEMQKIAREFNFSETTFIISKIRDNSFKVRIFTPSSEIPFAGHPTLGTSWVIQQHILNKKKVSTVTLDLKVGAIPVSFAYDRGGKPNVLWMKQNGPKFGSSGFAREQLAKVLGLDSDDIDEKFPIEEVSTGLYALIVPLKSIEALKKCSVKKDPFFALVERATAKTILVFSPQAYNKTSDLSVRVFPLYYGISEDPATGSGNGCLAAYLSKHKYLGNNSFEKTVDQGYEIGRPSKLFIKVATSNGDVEVYVGGKVTGVAEGRLFV